MLSRELYDFNVFLDGTDYAGKAKQVTLPKITKKMREIYNAGMASPVMVATGWEELVADFTMTDPSQDIVAAINSKTVAALELRLLGYYVNPETGERHETEVSLSGQIKEFDAGSFKQGDAQEMKFTMTNSYYKYSQDGVTLVEIDSLKPFDA